MFKKKKKIEENVISHRNDGLNSEMLKIIRDINQNRLPLPVEKESSLGQWTLELVKMSIREASTGNDDAAIKHMIMALRSGVPEPMNSNLKKSLIDLIDQKISNNLQKNMKLSVSAI